MFRPLPSRAFLPVIHVVSFEQVARNAGIAFDNGAHGIWLISHSLPFDSLLEIYEMVRECVPDRWIGLNFLDVHPEQALLLVPHSANGLWVDSVRIDLEVEDPSKYARMLKESRSAIQDPWDGWLYGGVAFKYQKQFGDPAREAKLAAPFVDVVTTSGSATGSEPELEKIRLIHEAIPNNRLAIASGMTPVNIDPFLLYVTDFFVATGISDSFTELNPFKTRQMAAKIDGAQP